MINKLYLIMNQLIKDKNYIFSKFNYILITILPVTLLAGSMVSNITVVLIGLFFIIDLVCRKKNFFLKDKNFHFLIIIYLYLIFNSIFISNHPEALFKALAFIRFIFLAYAINFYFKLYNNSFLKMWTLIFLLVSFDILFEFFVGKNILGFESSYGGRIASFTGDELKIGGFYFGFLFICLALFEDKKKILGLLLIIFFIIALIIGERSNFIKILIMYLMYLLFFINISYIKKLAIFFLIPVVTILFINISNLENRYTFSKYFDLVGIFIQSEKNNNLIEVIKKDQHLTHYYIALKIFKENILFGKGFKSYRMESYNKKYFDNNLEVSNSKVSTGLGSTHPHQLHFELLSEFGIIGYLLILSNLLFVLIRGIYDKKEFLMKSSSLFIIATLIPFLPSGSFFTSYGATIFFINYSFLIKTNNLVKVE